MTETVKHIPSFRWGEYLNAAKSGGDYRTPSPCDERLLDERQLRVLFRRSMLDAGKAAPKAGVITASQFQSIVVLYKSPWILDRQIRPGTTFDLLESVRKYMSDLHYSTLGSFVSDWFKVMTWLSSAVVMKGADGSAATSGLLFAIYSLNPNHQTV